MLITPAPGFIRLSISHQNRATIPIGSSHTRNRLESQLVELERCAYLIPCASSSGTSVESSTRLACQRIPFLRLAGSLGTASTVSEERITSATSFLAMRLLKSL